MRSTLTNSYLPEERAVVTCLPRPCKGRVSEPQPARDWHYVAFYLALVLFGEVQEPSLSHGVLEGLHKKIDSSHQKK